MEILPQAKRIGTQAEGVEDVEVDVVVVEGAVDEYGWTVTTGVDLGYEIP